MPLGVAFIVVVFGFLLGMAYCTGSLASDRGDRRVVNMSRFIAAVIIAMIVFLFAPSVTLGSLPCTR